MAQKRGPSENVQSYVELAVFTSFILFEDETQLPRAFVLFTHTTANKEGEKCLFQACCEGGGEKQKSWRGGS